MEGIKEDFRQDMIERIRGMRERHSNKKIIHRIECGGCGKPMRQNMRNKLGYLCKGCFPPKRKDHGYSGCNSCPYEAECSLRIGLGLWVRCEMPDISDLERLIIDGGIYDETIHRAMEKSLDERGQRPLLEKAISQGAQKIYQNDLARVQRKISYWS